MIIPFAPTKASAQNVIGVSDDTFTVYWSIFSTVTLL